MAALRPSLTLPLSGSLFRWSLGGAALLSLAMALGALPLPWAAAATAAGAALTMAVLRVEWALLLLVFLVPLGALRPVEVGELRLTGTEIAVLGLLISWGMRAAVERRLRASGGAVLLSVVALLAIMALSTREASSMALSAKELLKWGEFLLVFLAVQSLLPGQLLPRLGAALLAAASLEALLGWAQFLFRIGPPGYILGGTFLRAYGTFSQPNPYAGYLGLALPLAAALFLRRGSQPPSRLVRWSPWIALLLLSGILISFSRGAWVATGTALALLLALQSLRGLVIVMGLSVLGVLLVLLGGLHLLPAVLASRLVALTEAFQLFDVARVTVSGQNWSLVERMVNWQTAWNMFLAQPWLGIGIGNFGERYVEFVPLPGWPNLTGHAHNYYLTILAEAGIAGLASYLLFLGAAFGLTLRALARTRRVPALHPWALAGLGVLVAYTVHNSFDSLHVQGMTTYLGLWLGVQAALVRGAERAQR